MDLIFLFNNNNYNWKEGNRRQQVQLNKRELINGEWLYMSGKKKRRLSKMTHTLGNYLDKNKKYIYGITRLRLCSLHKASPIYIFCSSLCWDFYRVAL